MGLNVGLFHSAGTFRHLVALGLLKLQVSFAKEPYKRDYILQKRPIILALFNTPPHSAT